MDYREKEEKLYGELQQLKDGNQASYNEVYSLSADYVYRIIYDLTQDVNASNEVINQVYSDIYYGISGLYAPEYFYAWAGQIATTDTVRYLIQQGRMELPKDEKIPYAKSVGVTDATTDNEGMTVRDISFYDMKNNYQYLRYLN